MSRQRLASTASFQAGRTIGVEPPRPMACNCDSRPGISLGECSLSSRIQSKPLSAMISAAILLHRLDHSPICSLPAASACLKPLRCNSMERFLALDKLDGDAAERTVIGVDGVALLREDHARERAGEHDMARLERGAERTELV